MITVAALIKNPCCWHIISNSIPLQFPVSSFRVLFGHIQSYEPMVLIQVDDGGQ